ncbi:hypothetical protein [Actinophytocola sp. NPDC049390]|uniref:hypothetical protein n=1 Tax=Actinophytocola sp. NPDC049390 TaxID=3363894 RepID=UPI0037B52957
MTAFARRWLSGDERTLGVFLVVGVLTMAFFRLDELRAELGTGADPLSLLLVIMSVTWWSLLPRSFVWRDPADLTWRDFAVTDRATIVSRRLVGHWLGRVLALGYLLAVLAAVVAAPVAWVLAGVASLAGAAFLALAVVRTSPVRLEWVTPLALAGAAVAVEPGPVAVFVLAAALAVAGAIRFRPGVPPIADAGRQKLVDGWRDRVLRVSGVQFMDLALLLPAARPARGLRLSGGLALAWLGVLGRARHVPTAVLLAVAAVAVHRTFPALPGVVVFTVFGYASLVPLVAGLGELWRSPGRRRWVGLGDVALRWHHLVVATAVAAVWALAVWPAGGWEANVLVTVPVLAACVIRTMTRRPPTYDNLVPVDTPVGALPVRLVLQTVRGPDLGVLALAIMAGTPWWAALLVAAAAVAVALLR